MSLARLSVARPVFTLMVTLIMVALGLVSLRRLQVDLLPDIELPTLTVRSEYQGASPEVMEQRVTAIIEEIVATVPGVEKLESTSSEGDSSVRVTFGWGTDIDTAAVEVSSRIEDERDELPEDMFRPRVSKFDIASFPVVILGVSSSLDPVELTTVVEEQIRHRFAQLPGVAQVDPWGGFEREIRVEVDPARLRGLGIPLEQILQRLRDANLEVPAGKIDEGKHAVTLRAPAQFTNTAQIARTVIAQRQGAPVRVGDIARVRDTYRKLEQLARVDGQPGLRIGIRKQSGANTVEVAERILHEIDAVNRDFPQIHVIAVANQGNFIERSIANVARSVLYGGGLALLVLLFFLRNVRSTGVIAVAIPVSLVATFALIFFRGLTINLMTLGGLALGVGMMVDNSIVVLENIFRRRTELDEPLEVAAVAGTDEVSSAIIASTITTLVIFLPLAFVRGVSGVLFQDLAVVITFALTCSLVVSLTLVPMLAAKLLRPAGQVNRRTWMTPLADAATRAFAGLDRGYGGLLGAALKRRLATIVAAGLALAASLLLIPNIGTEFLPPSDEGEVRVSGEMDMGTRLELIDAQTRKLESAVYPQVPEATSSVVSVGASGRNPQEAFRGEIRLSLVPASERERSNTQIADDLRRRLVGKIPGMEIRTRAPQGQFLLQRLLGSEEGLSVEVRGFDLATLGVLAEGVAAIAREVPGITDVDISRDAGVPEHEIRVDRDKAADLGLSPADVARAIETAVAGSEAGRYRVGGNSYRILVQLADADQLPLAEVLAMTVRTPTGEDVALANVVDTERGFGPLTIERKDQQRLVKVTANVAGRDLGSVASQLEAQLELLPKPAGYDILVAGTFAEQREAFEELLVSLLLSLALVYMVLAAQYESLRDPLVVMLSVPVAAIGVLVTLAATDTTLNVQSFIGCIMLGGIVVNNAILLVDQARRLQAEGLGTREAIAEAGRRRLRPILMTTATTVLALVPLAMGIGEGADAQAPLARAVLGGLSASTVITLVLVPVVFSLLHRQATSRG